jgi:hypothetical protein
MIAGFGDLRYARAVVDLPDVDQDGLAEHLYFVARSNIGTLAERWPIPQPIVRGLALELAVGFAAEAKPLPPALVMLLAQLLGLPGGFLDDPAPLYQGGRSDMEHRRYRVLAEALDAESVATTGKPLALRALASAIEAEFGDGPARSTLRQWRADADYRDWLDFVGRQYGVAAKEF